MSQSSAALNSPNPMKKKVITALIAVAIGHIGVLWAVSHIKPAELKPIDKKPLQVRFVKNSRTTKTFTTETERTA